MDDNTKPSVPAQATSKAPGYDEVMNLATRRGYFLRSADSYPNIPAGFWDFGPLGTLFKNRYIELWRRLIVKRDEMLEIDTSEILPRAVFVASGHVGNFADPIVECSNCHSIYRVDKLIEEKVKHAVPEGLPDAEYDALLAENRIVCSNCKNALSGTRRFNMMFKVGIGPAAEEAYLRPETCQGIFVDAPFLFKTQRIKLPKGFAQLGKSFRNEIAPRQGILRQREFYQACAALMPQGGSYQNFPDPGLADPAVEYYGANLPRLRRIKRRIDPENVFSPPRGQGILGRGSLG